MRHAKFVVYDVRGVSRYVTTDADGLVAILSPSVVAYYTTVLILCSVSSLRYWPNYFGGVDPLNAVEEDQQQGGGGGGRSGGLSLQKLLANGSTRLVYVLSGTGEDRQARGDRGEGHNDRASPQDELGMDGSALCCVLALYQMLGRSLSSLHLQLQHRTNLSLAMAVGTPSCVSMTDLQTKLLAKSVCDCRGLNALVTNLLRYGNVLEKFAPGCLDVMGGSSSGFALSNSSTGLRVASTASLGGGGNKSGGASSGNESASAEQKLIARVGGWPPHALNEYLNSIKIKAYILPLPGIFEGCSFGDLVRTLFEKMKTTCIGVVRSRSAGTKNGSDRGSVTKGGPGVPHPQSSPMSQLLTMGAGGNRRRSGSVGGGSVASNLSDIAGAGAGATTPGMPGPVPLDIPLERSKTSSTVDPSQQALLALADAFQDFLDTDRSSDQYLLNPGLDFKLEPGDLALVLCEMTEKFWYDLIDLETISPIRELLNTGTTTSFGLNNFAWLTKEEDGQSSSSSDPFSGLISAQNKAAAAANRSIGGAGPAVFVGRTESDSEDHDSRSRNILQNKNLTITTSGIIPDGDADGQTDAEAQSCEQRGPPPHEDQPSESPPTNESNREKLETPETPTRHIFVFGVPPDLPLFLTAVQMFGNQQRRTFKVTLFLPFEAGAAPTSSSEQISAEILAPFSTFTTLFKAQSAHRRRELVSAGVLTADMLLVCSPPINSVGDDRLLLLVKTEIDALRWERGVSGKGDSLDLSLAAACSGTFGSLLVLQEAKPEVLHLLDQGGWFPSGPNDPHQLSPICASGAVTFPEMLFPLLHGCQALCPLAVMPDKLVDALLGDPENLTLGAPAQEQESGTGENSARRTDSEFRRGWQTTTATTLSPTTTTPSHLQLLDASIFVPMQAPFKRLFNELLMEGIIIMGVYRRRTRLGRQYAVAAPAAQMIITKTDGLYVLGEERQLQKCLEGRRKASESSQSRGRKTDGAVDYFGST